MPTRSRSSSAPSNPAARQAWRQAASANCVFRPESRCGPTSPTWSAKRKFLISALNVVGNVEASKSVVRSIPDSPASRRLHTPSMSWPIGVIQPIPVMTTRRMLIPLSHPLEHQRRVLPAQAVNAAHGYVHLHLSRSGRDVELLPVDHLLRIHGRRDHAVMDR